MYEGRLVRMQVDWHARIFIASFKLAAGQLQKLVIRKQKDCTNLKIQHYTASTQGDKKFKIVQLYSSRVEFSTAMSEIVLKNTVLLSTDNERAAVMSIPPIKMLCDGTVTPSKLSLIQRLTLFYYPVNVTNL